MPPFRWSSTAWRLNSSSYGLCVLGMSNVLSHAVLSVSTKSGEVQDTVRAIELEFSSLCCNGAALKQEQSQEGQEPKRESPFPARTLELKD